MPGYENGRPDYKHTLKQLALARNAPAVRKLARDHGLSRAQLEAFLLEVLEEQKRSGREERLGPRYDVSTGKYTTLEEWARRLVL
jgi:hypothetical protein